MKSVTHTFNMPDDAYLKHSIKDRAFLIRKNTEAHFRFNESQ
jgi:hypothetical protein